ncbi:alpha/beta hydrolase [Parvularcula sp. LCG005]|uniref:alpha/beta hydrolase n=1 Tax=Parvularcula sp. LCG005 TaxID=3078805 RepID=UPI002942F419|nr:alpha/beta hydrolase [Parvularcula sp. LCG005]WOI52266.1 alpha/beta hydrolase [Parvularcula sp. LCG005]
MRAFVLLPLFGLWACTSAPPPTSVAPPEAASASATTPLMSWGDLTSRPLPQPTETLRYAEGDHGVIDVWLPEGDGPHRLVVMIHGGCWQKAIADRTLMNYAAEDLRQAGFAVWNIEYRGVDEDGGGYTGTYEDVAAAVDAVRDAPAEWSLDTSSVMAIGHSAGGHLAVWAASRSRLPQTSPLWSADPLPIGAVLNSGGLVDLEASAPVTLPSCLADVMDSLTGPATPERPDVFSDTSPATFLPPPATIVSVNGERDRIAPPELGIALTEAINASGGEARYVEIAGEGHVELIAPGTDAFTQQTAILISLLDQ